MADQQGDSLGVIERKWTLKGVTATLPNGGPAIVTAVDGPWIAAGEQVEVVPVSSDDSTGAVEALTMADLLADAVFDEVPTDLLRKMAVAYRNSRRVIAARGQSTAAEAFEQSSGGETIREAQARQLRGEHAFGPQPGEQS